MKTSVSGFDVTTMVVIGREYALLYNTNKPQSSVPCQPVTHLILHTRVL